MTAEVVVNDCTARTTTRRALTAAEQQQADADSATGVQVSSVQATRDANRQTLIDRATQALDTNRAFTALPSPTQAQALAQVQALTRQNTALIRLLVGLLDATD